ncbi:MAG: hypothetical protein ABID54_07665 [Pseudomonadota bacterium]
MNKEEIFAMEPGKELNTRIAEDVMGRKVIVDQIFGDLELYIDDDGNSIYCPLQPYSEDISAARIVVAKMVQLGHHEATFWKDDTRPEVICRAALLAVLKEKEERGREERRLNFRIVS